MLFSFLKNSPFRISIIYVIALSFFILNVYVCFLHADETTSFYSALELAEKTDSFWKDIDSIEVSFEYDQAMASKERGAFNELSNVIWSYDRKTKKERLIKNKIDENNREYVIDRYFDGKSTYEYQGNDRTTKFKMMEEFFEQKVKDHDWRRFASIDIDYNYFETGSDSFYRTRFPEGRNIFFLFNVKEDDRLTFSEIVKKYPSSEPERSVDDSGDVLWTFYLFPTKEAEEAFPKELELPVASRKVVINESKNFHIQFVKAICHEERDGKKSRHIVEYEVLSYLKENEHFFPKTIENRYVLAGKTVAYNRQNVSKVRFNVFDFDFDSFYIPEYMEIMYHDPDYKKVVKLSDNEPLLIFETEDEYMEYLKNLDKSLVQRQIERIAKQKIEMKNRNPRIILCLLGVALIIGGLWKRRRKQN